MTEDLLQDLVLYKKSHEKAISVVACSLITLFREVCPSLLVKKDRGCPTDPKARPKAYREVDVISNVPGVELLQNDENNAVSDTNGSTFGDSVEGHDSDGITAASDDEENQLSNDIIGSEDDELEAEFDDGESSIYYDDSDVGTNDDEEEEDEEEHMKAVEENVHEETNGSDKTNDLDIKDSKTRGNKSNAKKRNLPDFDGQLLAADASLRALKRLAGETIGRIPSESTDGILSNKDFQRIKELKAKKEAKMALAQHGLLRKGIPSSDQLSVKRVDPAKLEAHVRKRLSKEERLALVREGREERGKFQARTAIKQKKTGGLSNKQKEHKKAMPLAAKKSKVARSRQEKKKKQQRSGKQFRGKKAWK